MDRFFCGGETGFGRFLACGKPDMARPKVVEPVATGGDYVAYRPGSLSRLVQQRDGSSQRHG